ncbi:glycosyltransferase family A protein [Actinomycetes bacterium KLBMP 9797]
MTRVSVVIPNYNKAKTLRACLAAVYAQTRAPAEVIVVDDASTDGSRTIAAEFPCRVLAFAANQGPSAARNAGAAAATGDVLFFLDSDIGLAPDAIEVAVRLLQQRPECAVVQGIYDWQPLFADSRVEAYKTLCEHFWRRQSVGESSATLFAMTAIRRYVFDEVGGFDESLTDAEDVEFGSRLPGRYVILTSDRVIGRHDDVDRFWPYLTEHVRRAHRYGGLLVRGFLAPSGGGGRRRRTDLSAVASMAACVLAVATLPLALVSGWLLLAPAALVAGFVALDRALFGFVWRQRGAPFLGYVMAMQFLMYATQCVGMCAGALNVVWARRPLVGAFR